MPQKKRLFVIFCGAQQAAGTSFISKTGTPTKHRVEAAIFYEFVEATRFAKEHNIELNAHTYIGQEDFLEHECNRP